MKLGILGAGGIAGTMADTVNKMNRAGIGDVQLYAVAARDLERAKAFARKNGVEKAFGSYEEMLSDPELDLVYVATPHSHHMEHAKLCVMHGKAALVEKAFTANAAQARELIALAEEKKVLVTEAIWPRYQPMRKIINEVVFSGIVGEPRTITANLSYLINHVPRIVEPALAGGALLDVGVYALNFAEMVFGRCDRAAGIAQMIPTGVDSTDAIMLFWKNGRRAVLTAGTDCMSDRKGIIYCTEGFIIVENINNPQSLAVYDKNYACIKEIKAPAQQTGYEYEVLEAVKTLKEGGIECPSMPHEESLHVMELMDDLRAQMGVKYPFE
ncbi:MAG: Gfo/Idh/MocA family oxidoreductase [Lachnospiraceae bacterium]|nr:Gfo/Idh/MocA family oxidoreductase [Lachnospiraceae bacterium]